jgi:hypothetical protein
MHHLPPTDFHTMQFLRILKTGRLAIEQACLTYTAVIGASCS